MLNIIQHFLCTILAVTFSHVKPVCTTEDIYNQCENQNLSTDFTCCGKRSKFGIYHSVNTDLVNNSQDLDFDRDSTKCLEQIQENKNTEETFIPHSSVLKPIRFAPWLPFSNQHDSKRFKRLNCPLEPENNYPEEYPIMDLLNNWSVDNTDIPPIHFDSLCHFDYQNSTEYGAALKYQKKELPFIMYNIPEVNKIVKKWNNLKYLNDKLANQYYRTEVSKTNRFMYWSTITTDFLKTTEGKVWEKPTEIQAMQFHNFIEKALIGHNITTKNRQHFYFSIHSNGRKHWLYKELPFFQPKKSIFIVDPHGQREIHCRFGMKSVIAEAHFDTGRNSVVCLGGLRRWILSHPKHCSDMYLHPKEHPSARHSSVDWANPDFSRFSNFSRVHANEVILQPGDFLFVPTNWIHFIISLNINYQCNSRSGVFHGYDKFIEKCGFLV